MMRYILLVIAVWLLFLPAKSQVTLNLESGIYFLSIENVSDGGQGDIISYPDDFGIRQLPNIRAGIRWHIKKGHIIYGKAVILQFSKTAELNEPREYQGYVFPAGEPIDLDYKFNGYRIGYTYRFINEETFEVGAGFTLNIRQGLIRFSDENEVQEFSKDPVPLVPLINNYMYFKPKDWFALNTELEFLYFTPDGWVFDMLVAATFKPAKWIHFYTGYRGYGGNGYGEGRFGNRLWANTWVAGINFTIK